MYSVSIIEQQKNTKFKLLLIHFELFQLHTASKDYSKNELVFYSFLFYVSIRECPEIMKPEDSIKVYFVLLV